MIGDLIPVPAGHQAPAVIGTALPNSRHEIFAQHVAAGHSLTESYRIAGYSDNSDTAVRAHSCRLASAHHVQARIRALREAAAERAEISIASRMALLDSIVHAPVYELERVVRCVCPTCWPDVVYAEAVARYLASPDTVPPPDVDSPRPACPGGPHQRIETTPTDELSGAARASYRGARYRPDGSIEVLMEDRQSAIDLLNKMQGVYVQRSESRSMSISATVDAADITPAALAAAWSKQ
jgi:hypothetical protein